MRAILATCASFVVALAVWAPAQASPSADLTVYRVRAFVDGELATTVPDQYPVVFKAYAKNLGSGTSDMTVTYSYTRHLSVRRETCIVPASETGDFADVSADTPSCEWTAVPAGDYAIVRVRGYVVGEPGQTVAITFCVTDDGNTTNNCKTARLTISG